MSLNWIDWKKVLIIIGIILITAAAVFFPVRCYLGTKEAVPDEQMSERENTILLTKRYIERGEYERAMNLLDSLLIKNALDEEALAMIDEIIALKAGASLQDFPRYSQTIDVNTQELEKALSKMEEALRQQQEAQALTAQKLSEQAEQASLAAKKQEELAAAQLQEKEESKRREELAAAEAAKQKAYEEELAKQNKALQEQIERVNDEIGRASCRERV